MHSEMSKFHSVFEGSIAEGNYLRSFLFLGCQKANGCHTFQIGIF